MFEFKSKIRFSETDEQSKLTAPALLNYFQDCSTFQSEGLGPTIAEMRAGHFAWVLVKWQIEINEFPSLCDDVIIGTIPYACQRCNGMRNYYMKRAADGEILAQADSTWGLIDTESAKLIRVTDEMKKNYTAGEKLELPSLGRRIEFEGQPERVKTITFSDSDRDSYLHVNNAKTVAAAWELVRSGKPLTRLRTEFRRQIFSGDEIAPEIYRENKKTVVVFKNSDGDITTISEFTTK